VLVAGVDGGLPQPILNRLWTAVGRGAPRQLIPVDRPPVRPAVADEGPGRPAPAAGAGQVIPVQEDLAKSASTFDPFTMPLGAGSRPPPRFDPFADLKPLAETKTVMIVDDDPMMLDVIGRILQRENFRLLTASDGPAAIRQVEAHGGTVDLLVTDFAMPGMLGRELAERVRQRCPTVKVLYQTGFSDMLFEDRFELEEGAAFLEKPFTARGLREAARLALFGTINPG
jgi:CheY-like chemotaxis protein